MSALTEGRAARGTSRGDWQRGRRPQEPSSTRSPERRSRREPSGAQRPAVGRRKLVRRRTGASVNRSREVRRRPTEVQVGRRRSLGALAAREVARDRSLAGSTREDPRKRALRAPTAQGLASPRSDSSKIFSRSWIEGGLRPCFAHGRTGRTTRLVQREGEKAGRREGRFTSLRRRPSSAWGRRRRCRG